MSKTALSSFIVVLAFCVPVLELGCRPSHAAAPQQRAEAGPPAASPDYLPGVDQAVTDTARVLAGLPPGASSRLATVAARPEWQAWQREFDNHWTKATTDRFARIATWRNQELAAATGTCGTLMYPFAGPDILNALLFFPECSRYVMFGLEQTGSMPPVDQLPSDRLARLLEETRHALNDLLERNYFITSHMMQDTAAQELRGTLPLMAVILVRMNAQIISAREMEIADDGQLRPRTPPAKERRQVQALEVVFARPGHEQQTIVYFRAQAEDRAISQRQGVLAFLNQDAPYPTFLKSASYLLHGNDFSVVRNLVLKNSRLVLEDDSGIPLRFLKAPDWTVTFYGKYDKPVKDFNYGYQPDMAKIFADERAVKPLPFSFGYHWKDGASSVLLAVKNPSAPPR
jgi:hypothetical protein